MRAAVVLIALAGCYDPAIVNGGLGCTDSNECPIGYHCAWDHHCWKQGTEPTPQDAADDALTGGGMDLRPVMDLSSRPDLAPGSDLRMPPTAPTGLATSPASPSSELHPHVSGSAQSGTTVTLYATADCSGTAAASGTDSEFSAGLPVSVISNSTTSFSATATDGLGAVSGCSASINYVNDVTAPAAPSLTATSPVSPSSTETQPFIIGSAEIGSTVSLFTDSACAGPSPAAVGTAAELASPGLQVTVGVNTSTTFYAHAVDAAGNVSPCSSGLVYIEDPAAPPAPTNLVTAPGSPAKSTAVAISGQLASGNTVAIFNTVNCTGTPLVSGPAATFTSTGLSTVVAQNSSTTFYAQATSIGGHVGPCSSGVTYVEDETAPLTAGAQVLDGPASDLTWTNVTGSISANWSGFADALSGIASYEWSVSNTTACNGEMLNGHSVGAATSASSSSVSLLPGHEYFNCVRAIDAAGNPSAWVASSGITVDTTAPDISLGVVRDGTAADVDWWGATPSSQTTHMSANWSGFSDALSGIGGYNYQLSSKSDCTGTPLTSWSEQASSGSSNTTVALSLSDGVTLYNCVQAVDAANNVSNWVASNGVTTDFTAPSTGSVHDGVTGDVTWTNSNMVGANWSGFSDGSGSQIAFYNYELHAASDCSDTALVTWGATDSPYTPGPTEPLVENTTYYSCIQAVDNANNKTAFVPSNGFKADFSKPTGGTVKDGPGNDLAWWTSSNTMSATWGGFTDSFSGIDHNDWGLSASPTCASILTEVDHVTSVTNQSTPSLSEGTFYYNCARAVDVAGNVGDWVASNGVRIDLTPPVANTVRDGSSVETAWSSSTTSDPLNWDSFTDALSGVASYDVFLANDSGCTSLVAGFSSTGLGSGATSATLSGGTLLDKHTYYNCVRAWDNAGLSTTAASVGYGIDTDNPSAPTITSTSINSGSITVSWSASTDGSNGSGILNYDVLACSGSSCTPTYNQTTSSTLATVNGLSNCLPATIWVEARDRANNVSMPSVTGGTPSYATPNPTVVAGAGGFEYAIPPVVGATKYSVCWGATNSPSTTGTCLPVATASAISGFVEGQDASHLVPLNTAWLQARAIDDAGCASSWSGASPVPLYSLTSPTGGSGSTAVAMAGFGVAVLGDVNGDGFGDYAVSSGFGTGYCASTVTAYSGFDGSTLWSAVGPSHCSGAIAYFGATFGVGGDVDGDGYNDVLIGAPDDYTGANVNQGQWYLYSGKTGAQLCVSGLAATSQAQRGFSLAIIHDITGDGHADMLVGSPGESGKGTVSLFTYSGGNCVQVSGTINDPGATGSDGFGKGVAAIGDYNSDGTDDFAVSAQGPGLGKVYIFSGANPSPAQIATLGSSGSVGMMLAAVGDVDGDGNIDLLSSYTNGTGTATLFSGKSGGFPNKVFNGSGTDYFGQSVGPAGDIDGDGYADYFITAQGATAGGKSAAGSLYLYSGETGQIIYEVDGSAVNQEFATGAAGGADLDGDGRPDLLIADWHMTVSGHSQAGQWWLYSPLSELGIKKAESFSPWLSPGYCGVQTPIAGVTTPLFSASNASGAATWALVTNSSGATLSAGGSYAAGGVTDVLDTVSVTDSLNREFETRVWNRSAPGAVMPSMTRPISLHSTTTGSGTVALAWTNPSGNPGGTVPVVAARQATQTWTTFVQGAGATSYTFNGAASTFYRFRVKERSSKGDSAWSNEIIVATGP
jgi:hypothetical protein